MANKKARTSKKIKSKFSAFPIQEVNWRDYMLELLLLGNLGEKEEGLNALRVLQELRSTIGQYYDQPFDGSVSAWNNFASICSEAVTPVVEQVPSFFYGATAAIFRCIPLYGSDQVLKIINEQEYDEEQDWIAIAQLVRQMWEGRGRAATRAKSLHLWVILSKNKYTSPSWDRTRDSIEEYLRESIPENVKSIRASWLLAREDLIPSSEWAIKFWSFGMTTPCIPSPYNKPSNPPWPIDNLLSLESDVNTLLDSILSRARPTLDHPVYDVLGGLLVRMRSLMSFVLGSSSRDEGEAAEIFLRCLADTNITIRWLLKQEDRTIFLKFQNHSHEQEKLAVETLRTVIKEGSKEASTLVEREYANVHRTSGRWPELMDVTLGPWNDISIAKMAKELGTEDEQKYKLVFGRASDAVHGSWRDLRRFHLDECLNPLHNGHYLPAQVFPRSAGVTPIIGAFMLTIEALVVTLRSIAPPEAEEHSQANNLQYRLSKWIAENFQSSTGTWKLEGINRLD